MGVGETFHWPLGDSDPLGSAVAWERLSQTHKALLHPDSCLPLSNVLPFLYVVFSVYLSFEMFHCMYVTFSQDYLFWLKSQIEQ